MSFFSDLKKMFFGAKAVGKSASQKVGKKTAETWEEARERAAEIKDAFEENTHPLFEDPNPEEEGKIEPDKPSSDDSTGETFRQLKEETFEKSAELLHKAGKATDQFLDKAEEVTRKVTDQTDKIWEQADKATDKLIEKTDQFWEQAEKKGETLVEDLKSMADKGNAWLDKMNQQAEAERKKEQEEPRQTGPHTARFSDSTEEKMDSFFEKAKKFAEGAKSRQASTEQDAIKIVQDERIPPVRTGSPLPGFEDLDGDGNELVDDAILDDGEPPKTNE